MKTVWRRLVAFVGNKVVVALGPWSVLTVALFVGQVGTGLGPTLEFYALVSRELQNFELDLWRGDPVKRNELHADGNDAATMTYVFNASGLFPVPLARNAKMSHVNKIKAKFRFLGKFMAKALMDSRMVSEDW